MNVSSCCNKFFARYIAVHCRTGSLENFGNNQMIMIDVHCRTGSLEIHWTLPGHLYFVHCRTGSLETGCCQTARSR